MSISVLLVDDHPLVRAGIAMLLEAQPDMCVVGEAADGAEALRMTDIHHPDVVLMDLKMPGMDGTTAIRQLTADHARQPDSLVKVLVLTTYDNDDAVYGALRAGASGFLLKAAAPADLSTAVRQVAAGNAWIDPAVAKRVISALAAVPRFGEGHGSELMRRLTAREREVLVLVASGRSNAEICEQLVLSEATVKTHVSRILMKTGSRDRAAVVALAHSSGFIAKQ